MGQGKGSPFRFQGQGKGSHGYWVAAGLGVKKQAPWLEGNTGDWSSRLPDIFPFALSPVPTCPRS